MAVISPLVFEKIPHSVCVRQHYQQQLPSRQPGSPAERIEDPFLRMLYQAIEEQLDNSKFDVDALAEAAAMSRHPFTVNSQL